MEQLPLGASVTSIVVGTMLRGLMGAAASFAAALAALPMASASDDSCDKEGVTQCSRQVWGS
jgi:hypothetical protein